MRRAGERAGWLMERLMDRDGRKALRGARAPAWIQWGVVVFACALPATAEATCEAVAPWDRLPRSAAELVGVEPLMLAVGAVAAPAVLAPSGADHELRVLAQGRLGGRYDLEPVSLLAPYVLTGGLVVGFGATALLDICEAQKPQAAMLQAVFLTAGTVALLKVGTGRGWPNGGADPHAADRLEHPEWATHFRPWREGLAAWPSGHTAVMVAAAAALRGSTPELGWAHWLGYPLAAGVAAGMWLGDHHWASDIVSGALLGEALGTAAGRSFTGGDDALEITVIPREHGGLLVFAGEW